MIWGDQVPAIAQLAAGWEWASGDAAPPSDWPVECSVGDGLDGCSLVWLAAEAGDSKILGALLAAGGKPGTANDNKTTPLHIAAQHHDASSVSLLLNAADEAASALADTKNKQGLGALALVCSGPGLLNLAEDKREKATAAQEATVVALLAGGANPELGIGGRRSALWLAAAHGHVGAVTALTSHEAAPVNRRVCADGCGLSPIVVACQRGHVAVVEALLDLGDAAPSGPGTCCQSNCGNPRQFGNQEHETEFSGKKLPAGEPWFCKAHARDSDVSLCAWTPYYVASASGQPGVVALLKARGLGDTADGAQPHSYTRGVDTWHQPKVLPQALPEALLPKSRPAIGDTVLLPASHKFAPGGLGKVVGHYGNDGACDVMAPGANKAMVRQRVADLAEAPPNFSQRPFPAMHQGIGRYYSAGNNLQKRYVMGVGTIAEGAGELCTDLRLICD